MKLKQFTIGQMMVVFILAALAIVTLQWISQHSPIIFAYALLASIVIGAVGALVVVSAALVTFSIYITEDQTDRNENLRRSINLFVVGLLMFTPLLLSLLAILLFAQ